MKKRVWIPLAILAVLIITYLAGPVPHDPTYTTEWPNLPSSLSKLQNYVEQTEAAKPTRKDNQARILWYHNKPTITDYSFVYLHGFAGSYRDGYPLNVNVADTFGANIYLARWADHGLKPPASLSGFTPEAAWESAKEALAIGQRIGRKVIIMSTSTGGTLALRLAAAYPDSIHALINISPNIEDDQLGAFLLNTPWGYELAHLVSLGSHREIEHEQAIARQYWDTLYPAEALVNLQGLVESTMQPETFQDVRCPVLTLYYHKNFMEEDGHVEIDRYPEVYEMLSTPDSLLELVELDKPGTHFIGSAIKSQDYRTAQQRAVEFCRETLGMKTVTEQARSANNLGKKQNYTVIAPRPHVGFAPLPQ